MTKRYRVVQWATGNIGSRALREVIRDPRLELVGVLVYGKDKDGLDAGALCGEEPTGVLATCDRAAILALGADCVLYMPRALELDDLVALLESGTNVVTTRGELLDGGSPLGEQGRARVQAACAQGSSSVYATGSSPGFVTEALPAALLSLQRRVDGVDIEEFADLSRRDSPELLFDLMGFGRPPESFDPRRAQYLLGEFAPSLRTIGEAAGRPIEDWACTGEVAVARRTVRIAAGEITAGTVAAQRLRVVGSARDGEVASFTANWYCTTELNPGWDLQSTGWRLRVRGDAPLSVEMPFAVAVEELGETTPGYTANRPVNAVPYVSQAAPGILRTLEMPPVTPGGPRGFSSTTE